MHTSIVDAITAKFGSQDALAKAIGVNQSTVAHWKKRGKDIIPARHQRKILEAARSRGIAIEPSDFFHLPVDN